MPCVQQLFLRAGCRKNVFDVFCWSWAGPRSRARREDVPACLVLDTAALLTSRRDHSVIDGLDPALRGVDTAPVLLLAARLQGRGGQGVPGTEAAQGQALHEDEEEEDKESRSSMK
jgi:hypothetical protein